MISEKQRERLQYFVDRIVSFIVPATSKRFEENDIIQYFVGRVTAIDEAGIWYRHLETNCMNFIFYENIISIAEEKFTADEPEVQEDSVQLPQNIDMLKQMLKN
jgi:hypothetical protein